MLTLGKHINPNQEPEPLVYDPQSLVVINVSETWSEVKPELVNAGQVTDIYKNNQIKRNIISDFNKNNDAVQQYLIDNYDELDEHADKIAELLGFTLSREVELEITATFRVTVELERSVNPYDIDPYDFGFDIMSYDHEIQDEETTAISIDGYNEL